MQRRDILLGGGALLAFSSPGLANAPQPILAYENVTGGQVGLFAQNLRTGRRIIWRAAERFAMCSTFKASLAALVLMKVDRAEERLDRTITFSAADVPDWWAPVAKANLARGALSVEDMCQAIAEQSDNTCANLLLGCVGGPAAVTAFWRRLGIRDIRLDDNEPRLNRVAPDSSLNTTTPQAMGLVLQKLLLGTTLTPTSRDRLRAWMIGCKTGANRLRAGLPSSWTIADKTGNNGADAAGDIAVVWPRPDEPIVICAYTRGGHPSPDQLTDLFRGIGRTVAERLA